MPVYPWQRYSSKQIHSLANGTTFWNLLRRFQRRSSKTYRSIQACASCAFLAHWKSKQLKRNGNRKEKKKTTGKKKRLTKIFRLPSCRKARVSRSFSQIDGDEELSGISCPNQSLGKAVPTATDVGSAPGSALNFLWDWASYLKLVVLQRFINSSVGQITV